MIKMTNQEAIIQCINELKNAGIAEYESDARILFEHVTGINKTKMFLTAKDEIDTEQVKRLKELTQKRVNHIPVQYLTGIQNFMGYDFIVNDNVLIPRFDTEILVENVLKLISEKANVLDICTGSGCIIISLMLLAKNITGTATDISAEALKVAMQNASKHKVTGLQFINTNLVDGVNGEFDLIVSNPPYIESDVVLELDSEVKDHEPRLALDGGKDGLIFYRRLVNEALGLLKPNGYMAVEIGYNQGIQVKELFENAGLTNVKVIKDYAGLDRVVIGRK